MISEFPLFWFTTLAGLGAGAYLVSAVFPLGKDEKRPWLFPLVCLALLAVGLVGLPLHLGRPERMFIALSQPSAMIAQEAYWAMAFGVVMLIDLIMSKVKGSSPRALRVVGGIAGLGLMIVMANAYFVSGAIPAWATWQTFPVYVFGDLAMGAALVAVFDSARVADKAFAPASAVLSALAVISFALMAAHFVGVGADFVLLVVGAVIVVAGLAVQLVARMGKLSAGTGALVAFACVFIGVAVVRYGFYAASML